jgi:alanine dehydrogenase
MVIGGGVAGLNAAKVAVGMGADVTILERDHDRLRFLDDHFHGQAKVVYSSLDFIEKNAPDMDLIIGAVLIPGASAPKLVSRDLLKKMRPGTVMVDIAIDQGGCFETSKATTHAEPVYVIDGVVHYCVANMPGAVPLTSALALNNAVLPYTLQLADKGWKRALMENPSLKEGLNVCQGKITYRSVAESLDLPYSADCATLAA